MERYIDADKLIWQVQDSDKYGTITKQVFISLLQNSETADVAPVVHAHWIRTNHGAYRCSNCTAKGILYGVILHAYESDYCPDCGAKMDEVVEDA